MTPALEVRGVRKAYRRRAVLAGVDLAVAPGEFFGLVGLNGCGKTTLFKSVLDFCAIDGGSIALFGVPHREARARARLAYLPEQFRPPYFLTGGDFLAYVARLHGRRPDRAEAVAMLERLDLDPSALAKPVRQYSKGMAQKLGLAGCFLSGKGLFLLDEPMSGLDPKSRLLVKRHLLRLKADGATVCFSTHMLFDVQELCDRMGVLHAGRLRFVGTPAECCRRFGTDNLEHAYLACIDEVPVR